MMQRDEEGEDLLLMTSAGHATNMVTGKNFYHTHQRERVVGSGLMRMTTID